MQTEWFQKISDQPLPTCALQWHAGLTETIIGCAYRVYNKKTILLILSKIAELLRSGIAPRISPEVISLLSMITSH